MRKKFKFIGLFLCAFFVAASVMFSGDSNKVFADDNFQIGTANFNGTAENSAKVGDINFNNPEIGWKRFDDTNSQITYTSGWKNHDWQECYDGTETYTDTPNIVKKVSFSFRGTKFRIIGNKHPTYNSTVSVTIDGVKVDTYNPYASSTQRQVLLYNYESNKPMANHSVVLQFDTATANAEIDAIDIDSTGNLNKESISLGKTTDSLNVGQTDILTATVTPDDTTNKAVKWTSSDESVATVDENGKVTAVKAGTATITATTTDGSNLSKSCVVTVTQPYTPPVVTGNRATLTLYMVNGSTKQYDLSKDELNNFLNWYNGMTNPLSAQCYVFNVPVVGSYVTNKDYIPFNKIDDFKVQEYTK
ncbi:MULTISPECIES: Ig-like domain-containing protein [Clostridium]|uniref:Ig-like domain-containing protein n=1 Tax=Clostridium TaxID=1485 RepID=UPI0008256500|nr:MULTISPECIES: Ig-like domain-containing protein [Clostridium]PJI09330.1 hypothetical protein CUB90_16235 [Clostridium sp. CT7]